VPVNFPDYVEAFVEQTKFYLQTWDVKLIPEKGREEEDFRSYQAQTAFGTTELILFQVGRRSGPPDFRARACTTLPREHEFALFRDRAAIPNSYATLGALIPGEDALHVWSQCIIHEATIPVEAGTMAAAIVHAAPSIIETMRELAMKEAPEVFAARGVDPTIKRRHEDDISAWSDADFQRIQERRADFGITLLGERRWAVNFVASNAVLRLAAMDDRPFFGPGLLSRLSMPNEEIEPDGQKIGVNDLNFVDVQVGEAPTFGAWRSDRYAHAEHRRHYEFASFAPNILKSLPDFTEHLIEWSAMRAHTIKQRIELMLREGPRA
jgi:hypothetical protein